MIIGTAGHIDHGKTALVRALTGVETDRLKEEKKRGISIDLGFAYMAAGDGVVLSFVDVPGHEKFIRNMLAGATGIELVLLVVAANDGIMPQTIEHLAIVDLLGIERGIVALSKVDLVSSDRCEQVAMNIREQLNNTSWLAPKFIPCRQLPAKELASSGKNWSRPPAYSSARSRRPLSACRQSVFSLPGAGTVVTGTVVSGLIETGAQVRVSPCGLSARVR